MADSRKSKRGINGVVKYVRKRLDKSKRARRSIPEDYRERLAMPLSQWLIYHQQDIVLSQCYWMGLRALKNPCDAWIYQEIIYEVKPDFIIEIGSYEGGTTLYLCHLLDLMGHGQVISLDIDRTKFAARHDRITTFTGDSAAPEIVAQVKALCEGKKVLIIHDGDHTKQHVLQDLRAYADLVSINSYCIVEDSIVDLYKLGDGLGVNYDGPLPAIEQFVSENPDFVIDDTRERYIITYNPRGFLKRVR